jgi:hypothetical protein
MTLVLSLSTAESTASETRGVALKAISTMTLRLLMRTHSAVEDLDDGFGDHDGVHRPVDAGRGVSHPAGGEHSVDRRWDLESESYER